MSTLLYQDTTKVWDRSYSTDPLAFTEGRRSTKTVVSTSILSIKRILLDCPIFYVMRRRFLSGQTFKSLFMDPGKRVQFVAQIHLNNNVL